MINKTKMYRIDMLNEGTRFEMPSLKNTMKNLRLISTSDCSSLIEGLKRDSESEPWKPFRYHISNSVMVFPASEEEVNQEYNSEKAVKDQNVNNTMKRGRGRPKKSKPVFKNLIGTETCFSVKQISENNNLKDYEANSLIKEAISLGLVEEVGEQKAGRGKPRKIYKLI
jgi:hypothetical protein